MLTFRKMRADDYNNVDALMQDLHALHVASRPDMYVPMEHPYSREEFERRVTGENWICLLAESAGDVLGICFVELRSRTCMVDATSAYMHDIYVVPAERRGKIATMMYRMAEREARERGALRFDLMVWSFNEDAMGFYRRMGFAPQRYILEKNITVENFERDCEK